MWRRKLMLLLHDVPVELSLLCGLEHGTDDHFLGELVVPYLVCALAHLKGRLWLWTFVMGGCTTRRSVNHWRA